MLIRIKKIATIRIPLYYTIAAIIIIGGILLWYNHEQQLNSDDQRAIDSAKLSINTPIERIRLHTGKFTSPLLMSDIAVESEKMQSLKEEIVAFVEQSRTKGVINSAGIYIRDLNSGNWISIDGGTGFHPGSLIKVPVLITYLKQSETDTSLLYKKLTFNPGNFNIPHQTFEEPSHIKPGNSYTIKDLLYEMAAKSDNYATTVLLQNVDVSLFKKTFTDLGMAEPPVSDMNFQISPIEYSKFFRVLYNATYLWKRHSEYALSILAQSTFKSGITHELPGNVVVAHKFGEFNNGPYKELHEAGIFYVNNAPYLVTIMTQGNKINPMPQFLADVSRLIYAKLPSITP